jgi:hypothetical protein
VYNPNEMARNSIVVLNAVGDKFVISLIHVQKPSKLGPKLNGYLELSFEANLT